MTVGLPLAFQDDLHKVPEQYNKKPMHSFDCMERIGPHARAYIAAQWGNDANFEDIVSSLPSRALARLTVDELCKIQYSCARTLSVDDLFHNDPRYRVYYKIKNSMWRWGMKDGTWNEIVDSYNGLQAFTLDHPDFEVRLDYTTGWNPHGPAELSRESERDLYLDGVFAYLVYYKGKPVMTIGFSFIGGYKVFIQQIQLASKQGNRWLFKFPNRVDRIISAFKTAFPSHGIWIADGADIAKKSIRSYRNGYRRAKETKQKVLTKAPENRSEWDDRTLERAKKEMALFSKKACSLAREVERLRMLYLGEGGHVIDHNEKIESNDITHYRVTA